MGLTVDEIKGLLAAADEGIIRTIETDENNLLNMIQRTSIEMCTPTKYYNHYGLVNATNEIKMIFDEKAYFKIISENFLTGFDEKVQLVNDLGSLKYFMSNVGKNVVCILHDKDIIRSYEDGMLAISPFMNACIIKIKKEK